MRIFLIFCLFLATQACDPKSGTKPVKEYIIDANSTDLDLTGLTVVKGRLIPKPGYQITVSEDKTEMRLSLLGDGKPIIIKSSCQCSSEGTCHIATDAFYCVPDSTCTGCKTILRVM
jgi:hypothetical protein